MTLMLAGMLVVGCFWLYMMLELQVPTRRAAGVDSNALVLPPDSDEASPLRHNELNNIEVKIKQIEEDLKRNHQTISDIKTALHQIVKGDVKSIDILKRTFDALGPGDGGLKNAPTQAIRRVNPATRFVMPSDKRLGQSTRLIPNNANNNLSKPCLLSRSQSKVEIVLFSFSSSPYFLPSFLLSSLLSYHPYFLIILTFLSSLLYHPYFLIVLSFLSSFLSYHPFFLIIFSFLSSFLSYHPSSYTLFSFHPLFYHSFIFLSFSFIPSFIHSVFHPFRPFFRPVYFSSCLFFIRTSFISSVFHLSFICLSSYFPLIISPTSSRLGSICWMFTRTWSLTTLTGVYGNKAGRFLTRRTSGILKRNSKVLTIFLCTFPSSPL